jgi:serine/threonine protein kinase
MLKALFNKIRKTQAAELPGYTPLGTIHEGPHSVIFKARQRATGRIVAVKVHKRGAPATPGKPGAHHHTLTEGQITASFDHPNVIQCFDHGDLAGTPYVVLEYLEAATLASLTATGRDRIEGKRLAILREAAAALAHVHARRFVHRNVCPKNLFVTADDHVKLFDFSLATPLAAMPITASRAGTIEFVAPEALRREPSDNRADVYAWGVVAYNLLSGHWPFESPEHHQTLSKILNVRPAPLERRVPALPPEVSDLVMRCIEKDPAKRLSGMPTAIAILERHREVAF